MPARSSLAPNEWFEKTREVAAASIARRTFRKLRVTLDAGVENALRMEIMATLVTTRLSGINGTIRRRLSGVGKTVWGDDVFIARCQGAAALMTLPLRGA